MVLKFVPNDIWLYTLQILRNLWVTYLQTSDFLNKEPKMQLFRV